MTADPVLPVERVATEGVWITAGWDMNWYDVRPHASELDALRYINSESYTGKTAYFVAFGEMLDFNRPTPARDDDLENDR